MQKKLIVMLALVFVLLFAFSTGCFGAQGNVGLQVSDGTKTNDIGNTDSDITVAGWSYNSATSKLTITGNGLTLKNTNTNTPVDVGITVESTTSKLTLDGVNLQNNSLNLRDAITVTLAPNSINTMTNNNFYFMGSATFDGTGTLNMLCDNCVPFNANVNNQNIDLTLSGGTYNLSTMDSNAPSISPNNNNTHNLNVIIKGKDTKVKALNSIYAYNVTITDATLECYAKDGIERVAPAIECNDLTIEGTAKVTAKVITSNESVVNNIIIEKDINPFQHQVIFANGSILFKGSVDVMVSAEDSTSDKTIFGIISMGTINFQLSSNGIVTSLGSKKTATALKEGQGLIVIKMGQSQVDALNNGKYITFGENNLITSPNQGSVVSGDIIADGQTLGQYEGIGKDGVLTKSSVIQNIKLNDTDHFAYMKGYPDSKFMPKNNLTRAEAAAIFARLTVGFDEKATYASNFADVSAKDWAKNYIGFLQSKGMIQGYPDKSFRPDAYVSRAELVVMTVNFFKWEKSPITMTFKDVPSTYWAYEAINAAYAHKFIVGFGDNTFAPDKSILRCDTAMVINSALERKGDKDFIKANISKMISYPDVASTDFYYLPIMEASNSHLFTKEQGKDEVWTSLK